MEEYADITIVGEVEKIKAVLVNDVLRSDPEESIDSSIGPEGTEVCRRIPVSPVSKYESIFVYDGPSTSTYGNQSSRTSRHTSRTAGTPVDPLAESRSSPNESVEVSIHTDGTNDGGTYGTSSAGECLEVQMMDILDPEIPICIENCLALNQTYQKLLNDALEKLGGLLGENKERQNELNEELKQDKISDRRLYVGGTVSTRSKNKYNYFGRPYFRDANGFQAPPNEDYAIKRKSDELEMTYIPCVRPWFEKDVEKLRNAVLKDCMKHHLKFSVEQKEKLVLEVKRLKEEFSTNGLLVEDAEKLMTLEDEIERLNGDIRNSKRVSQDALLRCPIEKIDWLKISATDFEGSRTAEACQLQWKNRAHPHINNKPWTEAEDLFLKTFGKNSFGDDWEEIAKEMNTKRSAFSCFARYQNKFEQRRGGWTEEEDRLLKATISKCRIGNYIPWGKVVYCLDGWSRKQVVQHWQYTLNPAIRKGRFLPDEDELIVLLMQRFGQNFSKISQYLPGRVSPQVSTHYRNYIKPVLDNAKWSRRDDRVLMQLVAENGCNWKTIAARFSGHQPYTLRHRYMSLVSKMSGNAENNPVIKRLSSWSEVRQLITSVLTQVYGKVGLRFEELNYASKGLAKKRVRQRSKAPMNAVHLTTGSVLGDADMDLHHLMKCTYSHMVGREREKLRDQHLDARMKILKIAVWLFCGSLKVPAPKTIEDEHESDVLFLTKLVGSEGNLSQSDFNGKTLLPRREVTGSFRTVLSQGMANGTDVHLLSTEATTACIKALLPPCFTNTMGFRCLLLARRLLKIRVAEADLIDDDDDVAREFDHVVDPHINIWNSSSSLTLAKRIKRPTPEQGALYLRHRFMSLFAWPAVVSNALVEPTDADQDKGSDSDLNEDEKDQSSDEPVKSTKLKRRSRMFTGKAIKRKKYMKMRWDEAKEKKDGSNPFKSKKQ